MSTAAGRCWGRLRGCWCVHFVFVRRREDGQRPRERIVVMVLWLCLVLG
jgi:hypothetical protein